MFPQGSGAGNTAEDKRGKAHVSPTMSSVLVPSCFDVRRKVKEEKPTFLPQCSQFPYFLVPMYARIVKHDERVSFYAQGKVIEVLNDLVRVNAFSRGESMIAVVPVYHAEDVDSLCFLGRDIHIFVTELPAVGIASRKAHSLRCIRDSHRRNKGLSCRPCSVVQVLATSRSYTHRVAARVLPLGVFLFAYILRQC